MEDDEPREEQKEQHARSRSNQIRLVPSETKLAHGGGKIVCTKTAVLTARHTHTHTHRDVHFNHITTCLLATRASFHSSVLPLPLIKLHQCCFPTSHSAAPPRALQLSSNYTVVSLSRTQIIQCKYSIGFCCVRPSQPTGGPRRASYSSGWA